MFLCVTKIYVNSTRKEKGSREVVSLSEFSRCVVIFLVPVPDIRLPVLLEAVGALAEQ
jgi:hypothetical protein